MPPACNRTRHTRPPLQVVEVAQPVVEQPTAEYFTKVGGRGGGMELRRLELGMKKTRTGESSGAETAACVPPLHTISACMTFPLPPAHNMRQTEDRPVMKERVTHIREHHPVRMPAGPGWLAGWLAG